MNVITRAKKNQIGNLEKHNKEGKRKERSTCKTPR